MKSPRGKFITFIIFALCQSPIIYAQTTPKTISGPFGAKPIQLSIGSNGITKKDGGFICDLDASLSGKHYSEWGESEADARTIVHKACSKGSGLLLCKKKKITCKEDK